MLAGMTSLVPGEAEAGGRTPPEVGGSERIGLLPERSPWLLVSVLLLGHYAVVLRSSGREISKIGISSMTV